MTKLRPSPSQGQAFPSSRQKILQSVRNASKRIRQTNAPPAKPRSILANPNLSLTNQIATHSRAQLSQRTPPTYPFLAYAIVKERGSTTHCTSHTRDARQPCLKDTHHNLARTWNTSGVAKAMQALPSAQERPCRLTIELGQPLRRNTLIIKSVPRAEPGNKPRNALVQ
jgi:hypothetical protein